MPLDGNGMISYRAVGLNTLIAHSVRKLVTVAAVSRGQYVQQPA
jgi:hypothetical protein